MLPLPITSTQAITTLPISHGIQRLSDNFVLHFAAQLTAEYLSLVPELNKQQEWSQFKTWTGERCDALKIRDFYIQLYENDELPVRLIFQFSFIGDVRQQLVELAEETGYSDIAQRRFDEASPERVRAFMQEVVGKKIGEFVQSLQNVDMDEAVAAEKHYWKEIHPNLPPEEQRKAEIDSQYFSSLYLYVIHNAIAVMSFGESLSSLVQRAVNSTDGPEVDRAICMAVRVDNNLREHPRFRERYLQASRQGNAEFLRAYDNPQPPLASRIRYRGLYFLMALLDSYGQLDRLSNTQLLELCDQAQLDRWGNRIEDEGYLGKRRREYQRHKFIQMSRHSM